METDRSPRRPRPSPPCSCRPVRPPSRAGHWSSSRPSRSGRSSLADPGRLRWRVVHAGGGRPGGDQRPRPAEPDPRLAGIDAGRAAPRTRLSWSPTPGPSWPRSPARPTPAGRRWPPRPPSWPPTRPNWPTPRSDVFAKGVSISQLDTCLSGVEQALNQISLGDQSGAGRHAERCGRQLPGRGALGDMTPTDPLDHQCVAVRLGSLARSAAGRRDPVYFDSVTGWRADRDGGGLRPRRHRRSSIRGCTDARRHLLSPNRAGGSPPPSRHHGTRRTRAGRSPGTSDEIGTTEQHLASSPADRLPPEPSTSPPSRPASPGCPPPSAPSPRPTSGRGQLDHGRLVGLPVPRQLERRAGLSLRLPRPVHPPRRLRVLRLRHQLGRRQHPDHPVVGSHPLDHGR